MAKKHAPYEYNRLLVALDASEMDAQLMATAARLVDWLPVQKIYFYHIADDLEIPREILEKHPDMAPGDETVEHVLRTQLQDYFAEDSDVDIEVAVIEERKDPAGRLLRLVKTKQIDLMILGRKSDQVGSGAIPNKLVKTAPCSVLFVTEQMADSFGKILVPMDFSEHASFALQQALGLAKGCDGEIIFHAVVPVPSGYHTSGKTREEFGLIMQGHAEKQYHHFMKTFDPQGVPVRPVFETNDDNNPADEIYERAVSEDAHLIVLGSKGRKGLSSMFLGSVATKVLDYAHDKPVLVVKHKSEGMSLLQALQRL